MTILSADESMSAARCVECYGRVDRPGLFGCKEDHHANPTRAQEIVWAIERELGNRRGLGWDGLDDDVADNLRDRLTEIVESILTNKKEDDE